MDSQYVLKYLKDKNTIATEACTSMKMVIDYNITPKEYLSYAKLDLDEQYGHHLINALCNAKRAFHCQLDIILKNLARKTANSFLSKKKLLEELGIITPRILAYIIHSGFISGYQNRYGDNLKPPTNVYHRMTA